MPAIIDEIFDVVESIKRETQSHLQDKAKLIDKLSELKSKEKKYYEKMNEYRLDPKRSKINSSKKEIENSLLLKRKEEIENTINKIFDDLMNLEVNLKTLKNDQIGLELRISKLKEERNQLSQIITNSESKKTEYENSVALFNNEEQKVAKIKKQLERQNEVKKNLEKFIEALNKIETIIKNSSPLVDVQSLMSNEIDKNVKDLILTAKRKFDSAQLKFEPNNVIPFLVEAQESYKIAIEGFIRLCDNIPITILDENFNHQIFTLVNHGFLLNTRHLEAVKSMLKKLEKGIEISPLASFSLEIKDYYCKNLFLLRIIDDTPS